MISTELNEKTHYIFGGKKDLAGKIKSRLVPSVVSSSAICS